MALTSITFFDSSTGALKSGWETVLRGLLFVVHCQNERMYGEELHLVFFISN